MSEPRLSKAVASCSHAVVCFALLSSIESVAVQVVPPSSVSIVREGKSNWRIASPSLDKPEARWATGELQKYIRRMSGCGLLIVEDAATSPTIVVGLRESLAPSDQALLPAAAKGYDGYAVAVRAENNGCPARIVLAGDNSRGMIYGAYDLLERLGCRWCYPAQDSSDIEVVPKETTLALSAGGWSVASPMRFRICNGSAWFFDLDLENARKQLDWGMKNRYNAIGWQGESTTSLVHQYQIIQNAGLFDEMDKRGMLFHGPGHSFDHFLRSEDYFDKHPEWFGLRHGKRVPQNALGSQFCWSNAEARRQFVDNVIAFVRACPRLNILMIVSIDGGRCCECAECEKGGASNLLMVLMSEVIDRLAKESPQLLVETVAGYAPMVEPPSGVPIHPRQRVVWAHWGRYYGFGYGDPRYDLRNNLETWTKAVRKQITVCQYYTDNFAEPWIIPPFAIAMVGDRQYFIEQGIESVYMLMWPPGYWWNHSLNGYVAGRCFYDASLDPWNEIHDFALHYYGPKAGLLLGDYLEEWGRHVDLAYSLRGTAGEMESKMLAGQRARLIDPAVKAVEDDLILRYRVAKVEKLHTLAEKLAHLFAGRALIQKARANKDFQGAEGLITQARRDAEDVLAWFHALADCRQGLIEKQEIPSFITWGVKNWIDEETKTLEYAREEFRMDAVDPAFANPVYEGADPWVVKHGGQYYFCQTEGDKGISVWKSDKLTDKGRKRLIWKAPASGWNRDGVWAPELHYLNGKWYIYYAASDGENRNHRAGVLESVTDDPQGEYTDRGILYTGDDVQGGTDSRWAIDATPFELNGRLYVVWSGWPGDEDVQYLYIAPMSSPYMVSGNRVKLCENDTHLWERVSENIRERGLHEGPEILRRNGKVFIVYSCSGSWEPTYKLGMLTMDEKADPLAPRNWIKSESPVFRGNSNVLGVGHACFVKSPDDSEDWIVYHTKWSPEPGWKRVVCLQPFQWSKDGLPLFGEPISRGRTLKAPAGESTNRAGASFHDTFEHGNWDDWIYFGYNRFIWSADGVLHLGARPDWGVVNDFRCGEKALVRGLEWANLTARVRIRIEEGGRDAGLLFRVRRPAVGYDAQRGYFAGIIPQTRKVVLGKMDGKGWTELALVDYPATVGQWYLLAVETNGDLIRVFVNDEMKIETRDPSYQQGMAGVRVVDTHALFDDFEVTRKE